MLTIKDDFDFEFDINTDHIAVVKESARDYSDDNGAWRKGTDIHFNGGAYLLVNTSFENIRDILKQHRKNKASWEQN